MLTILPAIMNKLFGKMLIRKLRPIWLLLMLCGGNGFVMTQERRNDPKMPTLWIIGDSTVRNSTKGQVGWGDPIAELFDRTRIRVENRALGGRSSRTFQTQGLWDQVLAEVKPGDFVLMQFGHNDSSAVNDDSRARGTLKGIGDESEEIDNILTKKHETVHTYGWYMRKYIDDTKSKGAIAIVLSPVPRNMWENGKVRRAAGDYGGWAAAVAKSQGAYFLDLNELVARRYEAIGPDKVKELYFLEDHTHTTLAGAQLTAEIVVAGLRGLKGCQLKKYLLKQRP